MKIFKKICIVFCILLLIVLFNSTNVKADNKVNKEEKNIVNIYVFKQKSCPHCANLSKYLEGVVKEYDNVLVSEYYTSDGYSVLCSDIRNLFLENDFNIGSGFPLLIIGGVAFTGDTTVQSYLEKYIEKYSYNDYVDIFVKYQNGEEILESDFDREYIEEVDIPIIGKINVKSVSLLFISIVLGFLDGVNPCAMWILVLLITLLIPTNDKKKIWLLGGAFLLTSGIFYFAMMMTWVSLVKIVLAKDIFLIVIGIFAICMGGYNLYKYIKNAIKKEDGCDVTSVRGKRAISKKIKKIINEKSLLFALSGIIVVSIIVNFIELACSAGMPLLFSNILAINNVSTFEQILYTLIYVLFFLIDDLIVFIIAALSLKIKVFSNKLSKYSNLIGGIIMLILGILMIFFPNILMLNF